MEQLSGTDSLFLYQEKGNNYNHVAALGIYDPSTAPGGKVRFKDILAHFRSRLDVHKLFKRTLVTVPFSLDRPYWIENGDLDIEYHVRHIALPQPGDWRQLMIQVARLHSRPLDRTRPLWEVYVIEGLDRIPGLPPGSFALFIKLHHASVDGQTAGKVLGALHSSSPVPEARDVSNVVMRDREPNALEMYSRAVPHVVSRAAKLAQFTMNLGRKASDIALSRLGGTLNAKAMPEFIKAPLTRFNGMISANRVVEAVQFPLEEMKPIRAAVPGSTVNDIFLTIVGGAMRKYLHAKNELPEETMHALMPISLRAEGRKATGGNDVGGVSVPVHSEIADPLERLETVYNGVRRVQEGLDTLGRDFLQSVFESLPNYFTDLFMRHAVLPQFNTTVSNVRGPDTPWYISGAQLVHFYPVSVAIDRVGLNHTCFSYNGVMWIAAVSCRNMMPDPAFYAECLRASFAELKAAALAAPAPKLAAAAVAAPVAKARKSKAAAKADPVVADPVLADSLAAAKPRKARAASVKAVKTAKAAKPVKPAKAGKPSAPVVDLSSEVVVEATAEAA